MSDEHGEQCEDCDSEYGKDGLVWRATDELWALLGQGERGLLCPNCFVRRLKKKRMTPWFVAVSRATYAKLMQPNRDWLNIPIPVSPGRDAYICGNFPLSFEQWEQFERVLEVMKPTLHEDAWPFPDSSEGAVPLPRPE